MTTEIAEYSSTESALAELRGKYAAVVFDPTTTKGMAEAKAARAELRKYRVSLEAERVRIKSPALERCRLIDTEARRITAELSAMEDPIDDTIKREEKRKEIERAAKEQAERERIVALNARFDAIRAMPLRAVNATVEEIEAVIAEAEAIDAATFPAETQDAAKYERGCAIGGLRAALDRRRAADVEQARIASELAELERLRAEQSAMRAEADRLAAAERERIVAEERRKEDHERAEREAIENAEREARAKEQARIDAVRAERRRIEDAEREVAAERLRNERAALDAAVQKAREDEIANATLLTAAADAVTFLKSKGHGKEIVTLKLESAIRREPAAQMEAA